MRYHLREIPALLRTGAGRIQIRDGIRYRAWPLLSRLATLHRRTLVRGTRLVAVVGSFGKSTTTRTIAAALGVSLSEQSTHNCFSGVAQAVLRVRPGQRHAVVEVGINKAGQMAMYARVLRPDIAVVTSIGSEHNRSLGTLDNTRHEKAEMVRALPETGLAVLNGDDPNVLWMKSQTRARIITFGFGESNDVRASSARLDWPRGTLVTCHVDGKCFELKVRLLGRHMVYAVLAALAVAHAEGLALDSVLLPLQEMAPTPGRLQPVALNSGAWLLRDDTKSAKETVDAALDVLAEIPARRRIIALGEVTEPIGGAGSVYREIGEKFAHSVSLVVVVSTDRNCRSYASGAKRGGLARASMVSADNRVSRAVEILREELQPGDVLLVKGRQEQHLERIGLALSGRRVGCDIERCRLNGRDCSECPMLERGWNGRPPVT
jgi:UDP-N-acetylmuramoyl-tripeptide--D-alanyl-D-alanine ligase